MPSISSARGNSGLTSQLPANGFTLNYWNSRTKLAARVIQPKTGPCQSNRSFQMHTVPIVGTATWAKVAFKVRELVRKHCDRMTGARPSPQASREAGPGCHSQDEDKTSTPSNSPPAHERSITPPILLLESLPQYSAEWSGWQPAMMPPKVTSVTFSEPPRTKPQRSFPLVNPKPRPASQVTGDVLIKLPLPCQSGIVKRPKRLRRREFRPRLMTILEEEETIFSAKLSADSISKENIPEDEERREFAILHGQLEFSDSDSSDESTDGESSDDESGDESD